jgi:hypothetical protein
LTRRACNYEFVDREGNTPAAVGLAYVSGPCTSLIALRFAFGLAGCGGWRAGGGGERTRKCQNWRLFHVEGSDAEAAA